MKNLFLLFISTLSFYWIHAKETAAPSAIEQVTNIKPLLNPDGTLNLSTGFTGSIDFSGYQVTMDDYEGIIATPLSEAAMTSSWSALGSGLDGTCFAIAFDASGNLYAGGTFVMAGGITVNNIAKWDGSNWSALGTGLNNTCRAIAFDAGGNLYAGGFFTSPGNYIAKWDGASWSALGTGFNNFCYAIAIDAGGALYAGGAFTNAGGTSALRIAKWDGSAWSSIGWLHSTCVALAFDSSGNLYVGGSFTSANGISAHKIAMWDGSNWSSLGSGLNCQCTSLAIDASDNVIAGGCFTTAGGNAANYIAKWDGSSWSAFGSGLGTNSYGVAIDDSGNIYAGGTFTTAGGNTVNYIAMWDGSVWSTLGTGLDQACYATTFDDNGNLYAGGSFTTAGGNTANYIAQWGDGPLPVDLFYFKGVFAHHSVQLTWTTASEVNNEGYQIEHSANGIEWEALGFIPGKGNSSATNLYEYFHKTPKPGLHYYRLKQIDYDGGFEYSDVINIVVPQENEIEIHPNPTSGKIEITGIDINNGTLRIFNNTGTLVSTQKLSRQDIDLLNFPAGLYFLSLSVDNQAFEMRIVKR